MKKLFAIVLALAVTSIFAQEQEPDTISHVELIREYKPAYGAPKGCVKKGLTFKCPLKYPGSGEIYSIKSMMMFRYFPKDGDKQTEMFGYDTCDTIVAVAPEWLFNYRHKVYTDYENLQQNMKILAQQADQVFNEGEFTLMCRDPKPVKKIFCQVDRKHLWTVEYDELGIITGEYSSTTDNPNYCSSYFQNIYKTAY